MHIVNNSFWGSLSPYCFWWPWVIPFMTLNHQHHTLVVMKCHHVLFRAQKVRNQGGFDILLPDPFKWECHGASSPFKLVNLSPSILNLAHLQRCWVFDPVNILFTSKFSYLVFRNPSDKTETGIAKRWETTNSKPPGPIITMSQSETLKDSQIILHSFLQVHSVVAPFTNPSNCAIMLSQNDLPEPNGHILTFLHPIFLEDYILSAAGDALIRHLPTICPSPPPAKTFLLSPVDLLAEHRTLVPPWKTNWCSFLVGCYVWDIWS
jgi:hypothetical protein